MKLPCLFGHHNWALWKTCGVPDIARCMQICTDCGIVRHPESPLIHYTVISSDPLVVKEKFEGLTFKWEPTARAWRGRKK